MESTRQVFFRLFDKTRKYNTENTMFSVVDLFYKNNVHPTPRNEHRVTIQHDLPRDTIEQRDIKSIYVRKEDLSRIDTIELSFSRFYKHSKIILSKPILNILATSQTVDEWLDVFGLFIDHIPVSTLCNDISYIQISAQIDHLDLPLSYDQQMYLYSIPVVRLVYDNIVDPVPNHIRYFEPEILDVHRLSDIPCVTALTHLIAPMNSPPIKELSWPNQKCSLPLSHYTENNLKIYPLAIRLGLKRCKNDDFKFVTDAMDKSMYAIGLTVNVLTFPYGLCLTTYTK